MKSAEGLEKYVPLGIAAILNARYDASDSDALLDVFFPAEIEDTERLLPTIVWIHGGGFLAGSKDHCANYLKILAAEGFAVVGVNYSLAPRRSYPEPLRQVNRALAFLGESAARFHTDPAKLFIAGDSAGAQIAAQLASIVSLPTYAHQVGITPSIKRSQIRGVILHCGVYGTEGLNLNGLLTSTMLWSYLGSRNFAQDPRLAQFSVARHVTAEFPAMFISAGNGDSLLLQSVSLADTAERLGVTVDRLFFFERLSTGAPP
jgi:acetyl esterase/lipase